MKVERTCKGCGGTFFVRASRLKEGRGVYCSRGCKGTSQEVTCDTCGATFRRATNQVRQTANYCTMRCKYLAHNRRPYANDDGTWTVPLTGGYEAIVDSEDIHLVIDTSWQACPHRNTVYAKGRVNGRVVLLHQVIARTPPGLVTDHIDGNGLNNRRSNLRAVTNSENLLNRGKQANNTSGYRGVSATRHGKYFARLGRKYLGTFATAEEAARAHDKASIEQRGEFANLNFPNERAA